MEPGPIGVLWVNVGSPAAPTAREVRRWLREFLGDPAVVAAPRLAWWFVLNGIVLPFRAPRSAELYRRIWTSAGSPLLAISERVRAGLARELGPRYRVALGMRYGSPSIADGLARLAREGCGRVLLFPAFPQWSAATSGSGEREARRVLAGRERAPELVVVPPYPEDPGFVGCLAALVREARAAGPVDHHVFSFHGLPESAVRNGDPYRDQCEGTARALARELGLAEGDWTLVYQSRFGRAKWLEPEAARLVPALAARHPRVLLVAPSFTADCLETLEELRLRLSEDFRARGGVELRVVPCPNDDPRWIAAAAALVRRSAGD